MQWVGPADLGTCILSIPKVQQLLNTALALRVERTLPDRLLDRLRQMVVAEGARTPFVGTEPNKPGLNTPGEQITPLDRAANFGVLRRQAHGFTDGHVGILVTPIGVGE